MSQVREELPKKKRLDAQGVLRHEMGLRLGMWYWRDESKTLEFRRALQSQIISSKLISFTPAVEPKEKGRRGKAVHFAEIDASDRLTDKRLASREAKSLQALEKRGQQGNVTLNDVKFVALLLLQESEMQRICSFTTFMRNKNLDHFLMALLYYLSHYLEKSSLEKQPKSYMVGLVEKKEMELVLTKLEAAQKYLAQKYCVLVLGLGMPDKHHMCCGREKISNTQKDWKFFEREDEESGGEKKRMTFVQFRRMMAKRPAIKTAIHMRSPVMSTLLPSLREKAQNIFEKKNQISTRFPAQMQEHMEKMESVPMPIVGILGQPRCLFNPHTLLPLEPEENMKSPGRQSFLIERNNVRIRDTLDLVMKTLSSQTSFPK
ncbi:protein phosphatase 1 regulatory subunit 36 isoform X5 [Eptesicus fuscus]|uniref:protein phosphatase 1 regulatory subunit 36 isoform X5 n=1 Tax=Eptesicus fuscus TaxID=29078 RepID=UPI00240419A9|nr:protein phosphatase 1 regulatory subunit 36 isoform X5 [Eptesicus fuscus]